MPSSNDLARQLGGPVLEVAPRLLNATLTHAGVTVRITEVEAYAGQDDPGSHAFNGPTPRSSLMFGPPAVLYVYFTYGMHHCANVVVGPEGDASAVLLRAGEVTAGSEVAQARRRTAKDLARGPARLCQALGIDLSANGMDLVGHLTLPTIPPADISTGPRVGLRRAAERPWRFWIPGDPTVSPYRAAKRLS